MQDNFAVSFTGSQDGMTARQMAALAILLEQLRPRVWRDGDCIGSDDQAHKILETVRQGFNEQCLMIGHPTNIPGKRAFNHFDYVKPVKDPIPRNHDMVDGGDLLIAAPSSLQEQLRSGTWATIRYARSIGRPTIILDP